MMIISKYGFEDLIQAYTSADVRLDPSRMAIGGGMYVIGFSATLIILATQIVLHSSGKFMTSHKSKYIKIYGIETPNFHLLLRNARQCGGGGNYKAFSI